MRSLRRVSILSVLLSGLLAPGATSAAVQAPPSPHRGSEAPALPPMPAAQPVPATPPQVMTPAPAAVAPGVAPAPAPGSPQVADAPRRMALGAGSTLLRRDAHLGAYFGPLVKVTGIGRVPGLMLGADFAVLLGERFALGASGMVLVTPLAARRDDTRTLNLRTQHAGLTLRVALVRVKFLTVGVGALVGGGRVCLNDERLDRCVNRAAIFVAEPELSMAFALTRAVHLVLSGGYRVAVTQAWSGPNNRQLSGLTGTLGVQIGKF